MSEVTAELRHSFSYSGIPPIATVPAPDSGEMFDRQIALATVSYDWDARCAHVFEHGARCANGVGDLLATAISLLTGGDPEGHADLSNPALPQVFNYPEPVVSVGVIYSIRNAEISVHFKDLELQGVIDLLILALSQLEVGHAVV